MKIQNILFAAIICIIFQGCSVLNDHNSFNGRKYRQGVYIPQTGKVDDFASHPQKDPVVNKEKNIEVEIADEPVLTASTRPSVIELPSKNYKLPSHSFNKPSDAVKVSPILIKKQLLKLKKRQDPVPSSGSGYFGILSLICGVVGLFIILAMLLGTFGSMLYLGFAGFLLLILTALILGIAAIVFGIISCVQHKKNTEGFNDIGFGIAGIITGAFCFLIVLIALLLIMLFV